ncbi:hypothetical protein OJ997_01760 [Solirubrobacter phytolaccae]|uniref:Fimbrial protein n=1 Tax=Solirubrobacter phytolaccae TaxID=1404360 RepID=A0A9X3N659_9ACTN|nr:hypothetical protein [Solirubrobacter phytolaccae]MDA0179004.1 hypothetical protein [Solirubrobacter phytolaccae]
MKKILPTLIATTAVLLAGSASAQAASFTEVHFEPGSTIKIHDDETFGSDVEKTWDLSGSVGKFKNSVTTPQTLLVSRCAGDEVRVEIRITRQLINGVPALRTRADLYEGDSCSTPDLDGSVVFDFGTIHAPFKFTKQYHVTNAQEGGDWAVANLNYSLKTGF